MTDPDSPGQTLRRILHDLRAGTIDAAAAWRLAEHTLATRPMATRTTRLSPDSRRFGAELLPGNEAAILASLRDECARVEQAPYRPGQCIGGRYLVESVHAGGFGLVCICRQLGADVYGRGGGRVALKTPLPRHLADRELRRMFVAEAAHCVALGAHPNLVHAYGVEEHHRLPFLVLECIDGARDLAGEIHAGATDWRTALTVGIGIARGLAFAGLVHGDLKPVNVLLGPTGVAKVADFGLALASDDPGDDGMLAGTPGFMAPEMFLGRPQRTLATDVFAFGATLYAVATRHLPFAPGQPAQGPAPDPRTLVAAIPAAFAAHLLHCLQHDPGLRPSGFAEIAAELARLHRQLLGADPAADPAPDVAGRAAAQVNLAQTWINLGEPAKALVAARAAVAAEAGNWRAVHALGLAQLEGAAPAEALRQFRAAATLAPDEVAPLANAALAAWRSGDADGAREHLRRAVRLASATDRFGELDGVSRLAIELLPERDAYDFVHAVLTAHPGAAMTWNNRAVLLRRMGAPELALESAERALALNPTYAHACVQRANALLELGRADEALHAAERALVLDQALAGAHVARCSALAALGRVDEARAAVADGLAVLPDHELLRRVRDQLGN